MKMRAKEQNDESESDSRNGQELRDRTGVSMGKCKEALDKASGDMNEAIDILRKAGMASAVKKEGRETNEGLIGAAEGANAVALVEVNAETDFVTQNEKFKQFLKMSLSKQQIATLRLWKRFLASPIAKILAYNR